MAPRRVTSQEGPLGLHSPGTAAARQRRGKEALSRDPRACGSGPRDRGRSSVAVSPRRAGARGPPAPVAADAARANGVQVSTRYESPGDGEDVLVQPPDLLAAVEQQAAGGFRVLGQETTQASRVAVGRLLSEFCFDGQHAPAVLQDEIDLDAGLCSPEVQPAGRRHQPGQHAQVMEDEGFEVGAALARRAQVCGLKVAGQYLRQDRSKRPWAP